MSNDESDPTKPWLAEFERYLMTHDVVLEGMLIVEWWGACINLFIYDSSLYSYYLVVLNYSCYPVWGSLARDYLSIMASSVSSEHHSHQPASP